MDRSGCGAAPRGTATVRTSYEGLARAGPAVRALLARGDVALALGPPGRPDLSVLDTVARLALAARRSRSRLAVCGDDLRCLAGLCGLEPVLDGSGEAGGQAQPGEQVGAEEVVDVSDPPT